MADEKKTEAMSDEELDQIIQDMSKEDEIASAESPISTASDAAEAAPVMAAPAPVAEVKPIAARKPALAAAPAAMPATANANQALTMELQGVVNLKVNFSSGGRSVELICSEDALVCRMADGTEFRIPLGATGAARKTA